MPRPMLGQAVEIVYDTAFLIKHCKWVKGKRGVVTDHKHEGDILIDNDGWSVSADRVKPIGNGVVYQMTDVRDEQAAGTLLELAPGERFVVDVSRVGESGQLLYLDREQVRPHYTDKNDVWMNELLTAGVIRVVGEYEKPQEFNSVLKAPLGMVLQYTINGEQASGAVYPFVVRTYTGIWGWNKVRWVRIRDEHLGPWLYDVAAVWSKPACFREMFVYPMPPKAVLYVQRLQGAINA